jgi:hypothetical protein
MITCTCWMRRAVGLVLAATLLTGSAYAQTGRGEIKGRVIAERPGEEAPRGLAGATVELRLANGGPLTGSPFTTPKTGEEGTFSFAEVPAGEYLLRIIALGHAPHEAKLYVAQDSVSQLTVRLERSIAGLAPGQKKTPRDPLPGADKITWDVKTLEESPLLDVVRREVKGRKVIWLLQNTEDNPGGVLFYRADFLDDDGVTLRSVGLVPDQSTTHNWRAGERNRLVLTLPEMPDLEKTRRVVIVR